MYKFILGFFFVNAVAHAFTGEIYDGKTGQIVTLETALPAVQPGQIIVIGENHELKSNQNQQLLILEQLRKNGLKVSVGMEFISYIYQTQTDQFRAGLLSESDFVQQAKFGGKIEFYRQQILFPDVTSYTWALNAPRTLTSRIAKVGVSQLTDEEKALLPPQFTLGNVAYRERFVKLMGGGHNLPPAAEQRYFEAQSAWDDTMAWRAVEFMRQHPDQVLVIIVGEFHVQYGGGLPDRILARGGNVGLTFSQVNVATMDKAEAEAAIAPHPQYGPRADFIWTSAEIHLGSLRRTLTRSKF